MERISKCDARLAKHLRKMKNNNNKATVHRLVWRIESGIINLMSNKMKVTIDKIWKSMLLSSTKL